ncbi:hypothetical protein [Mycobacteroides abscessus]|uniref:hypothetical protein n=1 Tax=Mycobacteroides abscessus TaxID=36809 RepID=UPI0009A6A51D|nr:hypothetical protein [Mycobacteroides abscessus]SKO15515.1 Uncharacterised protein [Mycobacteroides abscessus subsp. bolletii]SKX37288.1 Uncharacterised protein [Mycobacteroides abscessus subsp. bolletii]
MARNRRFVVDAAEHAEEIARFRAFVVQGPEPGDCDIWRGALSEKGYGRFWVNRAGGPTVVSAHRYALALQLGSLNEGECARHVRCDNPVCVRARVEGGAAHLVVGTQLDNVNDRIRKGRSRMWLPADVRLARARRLREAVAGGWDAEAVQAALLYSEEPTLF